MKYTKADFTMDITKGELELLNYMHELPKKKKMAQDQQNKITNLFLNLKTERGNK